MLNPEEKVKLKKQIHVCEAGLNEDKKYISICSCVVFSFGCLLFGAVFIAFVVSTSLLFGFGLYLGSPLMINLVLFGVLFLIVTCFICIGIAGCCGSLYSNKGFCRLMLRSFGTFLVFVAIGYTLVIFPAVIVSVFFLAINPLVIVACIFVLILLCLFNICFLGMAKRSCDLAGSQAKIAKNKKKLQNSREAKRLSLTHPNRVAIKQVQLIPQQSDPIAQPQLIPQGQQPQMMIQNVIQPVVQKGADMPLMNVNAQQQEMNNKDLSNVVFVPDDVY